MLKYLDWFNDPLLLIHERYYSFWETYLVMLKNSENCIATLYNVYTITTSTFNLIDSNILLLFLVHLQKTIAKDGQDF